MRETVVVEPDDTYGRIVTAVDAVLMRAGREDDAQAFFERALARAGGISCRDAVLALAKEYVQIAEREDDMYYLPDTVFPEIEEPRLTMEEMGAWLRTAPDREFLWGFTNTDPVLCFLTDHCGWPKAFYHLTAHDVQARTLMVGTPVPDEQVPDVRGGGRLKLWNISMVKTPEWVHDMIAFMRSAMDRTRWLTGEVLAIKLGDMANERTKGGKTDA